MAPRSDGADCLLLDRSGPQKSPQLATGGAAAGCVRLRGRGGAADCPRPPSGPGRRVDGGGPGQGLGRARRSRAGRTGEQLLAATWAGAPRGRGRCPGSRSRSSRAPGPGLAWTVRLRACSSSCTRALTTWGAPSRSRWSIWTCSVRRRAQHDHVARNLGRATIRRRAGRRGRRSAHGHHEQTREREEALAVGAHRVGRLHALPVHVQKCRPRRASRSSR